ncbi:MAG TPA: ATP-binding protein [Sumerlaeia bacterium]|nr:ATP-binding protein [Sumerlaeia bacterium]
MAENLLSISPSSYLELFSHLSRVAAQTIDLAEMLRSSVQVVQSVLGVENCSIMLLNPEGTELILEASSTIPEDEWNAIRVPLGEGVAGRVAQEGRAILATEDGEGDRGCSSAPRGYSTKSYICLPLRSSRGAIGVINVTDHADRRDFTRADLEMLQAFALLAASAIENHRLWVRTRESREHLSQVLEGLPVGMFTVTVRGTVTLCNAAARRYLNLPAAVELNRPWDQVFDEPVRSHVRKAREAFRRGESSCVAEFELAGAGVTGKHSVRISALKAGDITSFEGDHILFIIEDLQQMQELVELRRSDQMKSSFLSLVSHELRTPLAAIKGAIHLLVLMVPAEVRKSNDRVFDILQRNCDRLTRLVNNVLDVLDLEAGTIRLYRKRANLHEMIHRVARKFMRSEGEKKLEWSLDLRAPRPELYLDESRVEQVIQHLLENAIKFARDGGRIDISTRSSNGSWVLRTANTGRTIEPDHRERIFSKFYQVDGSLTRECGGSGLGLYLSREILRLHGGEIRVDPEFREGACFLVSLPETVPED